MNKIFAVGDTHGQLHMLEALLQKWNADGEQLIFLGDYIDRGRDSCGVVHLVKKLAEEYGARAVGGNHEDNFLWWLDHPEDEWFARWAEDESTASVYEQAADSESVIYISGGGDKTINSFYGETAGSFNASRRYLPSKNASYIKKNFTEEIEFLRGLPDYYECGDYVFVHAGVDLYKRDWKKTNQEDFRWVREVFHGARNDTGKTFVFGHHLTRLLNADKSNKVWISRCGTKIGIDGGAVFGGLLHGIVIDGDNITNHSADQNGAVSTEKIR